jgi:hypothetical protein
MQLTEKGLATDNRAPQIEDQRMSPIFEEMFSRQIDGR